MIEALKEEAIVNKVGGRFKLSTLIQKRLVALNAGARPLVNAASDENKMEIIVQEILQDKIYLDMSNELKITGEQPQSPLEFDLSSIQPRRLRREFAMPSELIVGVTGGIAAFKTAALVSSLVQQGHGVTVVMTRSARKFVGPATFRALTGRPVASDVFDRDRHPLGAHIELAEKADLMVVAPASADFLAKAACGMADDLLSTLVLSFDGPLLVAPAMNTAMWQKPSVQRNVETLRGDGVHFVDPQAGWQSCRRSGMGRLADPADIQTAIERLLNPKSK